MILFSIYLVKNRNKIKIKKYNISNSINIINSNTTISDEETPLTAVKTKRASMELYKTSIDGIGHKFVRGNMEFYL